MTRNQQQIRDRRRSSGLFFAAMLLGLGFIICIQSGDNRDDEFPIQNIEIPNKMPVRSGRGLRRPRVTTFNPPIIRNSVFVKGTAALIFESDRKYCLQQKSHPRYWHSRKGADIDLIALSEYKIRPGECQEYCEEFCSDPVTFNEDYCSVDGLCCHKNASRIFGSVNCSETRSKVILENDLVKSPSSEKASVLGVPLVNP